MPSLETRYMNLNLKNPIIVASSGLTNSVEKILACEEAGAGAVVIKSLFEEVLAKDDWGLAEAAPYHPEAHDYLNAEIQMQYGPNEYCDLISKIKSKATIPIIASIKICTIEFFSVHHGYVVAPFFVSLFICDAFVQVQGKHGRPGIEIPM